MRWPRKSAKQQAVETDDEEEGNTGEQWRRQRGKRKSFPPMGEWKDR